MVYKRTKNTWETATICPRPCKLTFDPHFKVMKFFEDEYRKNLKDKVTIAQLETICNMWNGTMFVDLD